MCLVGRSLLIYIGLFYIWHMSDISTKGALWRTSIVGLFSFICVSFCKSLLIYILLCWHFPHISASRALWGTSIVGLFSFIYVSFCESLLIYILFCWHFPHTSASRALWRSERCARWDRTFQVIRNTSREAFLNQKETHKSDVYKRKEPYKRAAPQRAFQKKRIARGGWANAVQDGISLSRCFYMALFVHVGLFCILFGFVEVSSVALSRWSKKTYRNRKRRTEETYIN